MMTWHLPVSNVIRYTSLYTSSMGNTEEVETCKLAVTLFPFIICVVMYLPIALYPRDIIADWRVHRIGVVVRCHTCQHTTIADHWTANLCVRLQQTQTHTTISTLHIPGPCNRLQPLAFKSLLVDSHLMRHNLWSWYRVIKECINEYSSNPTSPHKAFHFSTITLCSLYPAYKILLQIVTDVISQLL
jgi:hypothetical protein